MRVVIGIACINDVHSTRTVVDTKYVMRYVSFARESRDMISVFTSTVMAWCWSSVETDVSCLISKFKVASGGLRQIWTI